MNYRLKLEQMNAAKLGWVASDRLETDDRPAMT
jgi:hypothetical protein